MCAGPLFLAWTSGAAPQSKNRRILQPLGMRSSPEDDLYALDLSLLMRV